MEKLTAEAIENKSSGDFVELIVSTLGLVAGGLPPLLVFFRLLVVGEFDPDLITVLLSTLDIPAIAADELAAAAPFILFCVAFISGRSLVQRSKSPAALASAAALIVICFSGFFWAPVLYLFSISCGFVLAVALTSGAYSLRSKVVSLIGLGGMGLIAGIFPVVKMNSMWLPAEVIQVNHSKQLVYILDVDDHDFTAMLYGSKDIKVYRAEDVMRRDICDVPEVGQNAFSTMSMMQLSAAINDPQLSGWNPKMPLCGELLTAS